MDNFLCIFVDDLTIYRLFFLVSAASKQEKVKAASSEDSDSDFGLKKTTPRGCYFNINIDDTYNSLVSLELCS